MLLKTDMPLTSQHAIGGFEFFVSTPSFNGFYPVLVKLHVGFYCLFPRYWWLGCCLGWLIRCSVFGTIYPFQCILVKCSLLQKWSEIAVSISTGIYMQNSNKWKQKKKKREEENRSREWDVTFINLYRSSLFDTLILQSKVQFIFVFAHINTCYEYYCCFNLILCLNLYFGTFCNAEWIVFEDSFWYFWINC